MAGVMYQGYASYLQAYQRHSSSYCSPSPSFSFNPYDKKYRLPEVCGGTSSPNIETGLGQGYSIPPPVPSSVSPDASSTPASSSVPAAAAAVPPSSSAGASCSSPVAQQQQQQQQQAQQQQQTPQQSSSDEQTKTEEKSEDYADAHYLSANCVVLTYFSGDLASAVDEHFTRALNQAYSKGSKDPCPMSQRNLPASFWNSQYQVSYPSAGSHLGHDALYSDYSSFHGLPQPDPWAYNLTAAQQYSHHHRSVSDFTYMPSSSRYSHNYSSLLMGRPRLPQCVVGKSDPWSSSARLHEDVALDPSAYAHHFPSMTGLEAAGSSQDHSKDLYWF